ncbi:MAG: hypothetical protein H7X94_05100 [Vallitaleaceae bacterium]|nr:hypothetical protein [Vallitaleaceae bacterium]
MQYTIRVVMFLILIGLSVISSNLRNAMNSQMSIQSIGIFIINGLFVLVMLHAYGLSKSITRHLGIIIFESVVLFVLIMVSFLPQIDPLLNNLITKQFPSALDNLLFVHYIQFITMYWLTTFVIILRNRNLRRNNLSSAIRYMRS